MHLPVSSSFEIYSRIPRALLTGEVERHEETSVVVMRLFLDKYNVEAHLQYESGKCIMATKMPVKPVSLVEQILCDADTYHLGTPDFEHLDALVWQERKLYTNTQIDNHIKQSLHFLLSHLYFTSVWFCPQEVSPD
jgi:hypothetical protein